MRQIAFCGQKGGSGKSSLSVFTACEFSRRGHRVVLLDLDPQGTARDFEKAARSNGHPCPSVLGVHPEQITEVLSSLSGYDIVVFDCPGREVGGLSVEGHTTSLVKTLAMLVDAVLVPVQPSPADLWGNADTLRTLRRASGIRPELFVATIVNRADARRKFAREVVEQLELAGVEPLSQVIHDRVDFPAALSMGEGLHDYNATGKAALEIEALVTELVSGLKMEASNVA